MECSHALLAFLAGSRGRFVGVCPECSWELLCIYTVALDGLLVSPDSSAMVEPLALRVGRVAPG